MNANLYIALRQGFPQDLDTLAIDTDQGLRYYEKPGTKLGTPPAPATVANPAASGSSPVPDAKNSRP